MFLSLVKLVGGTIKYITLKLTRKIPYIIILHNPLIGAVKAAVTFYIIGLVKNALL